MNSGALDRPMALSDWPVSSAGLGRFASFEIVQLRYPWLIAGGILWNSRIVCLSAPEFNLFLMGPKGGMCAPLGIRRYGVLEYMCSHNPRGGGIWARTTLAGFFLSSSLISRALDDTFRGIIIIIIMPSIATYQ